MRPLSMAATADDATQGTESCRRQEDPFKLPAPNWIRYGDQPL